MAGTATLPTKSLLPLAAFTHNWVGGDINGLAAFAGTLYGYVPEMESVVTALNKKVGTIVSDAGWQGSAAQAFTGNWESVSAQVNAVGLVVIETGSVVDQLAANLSKIENALENAAGKAVAHGVQIATQPGGEFSAAGGSRGGRRENERYRQAWMAEDVDTWEGQATPARH